MKALFRYIVFLILLFNCLPVYGLQISLPDDFDGRMTRSYAEKLQMEEKAGENGTDLLMPDGNNIVEKAVMMYEIGRYLNGKYPDNRIFDDEVITGELKKFFPEAREEEFGGYITLLRNSVRVYRIAGYLYKKYVEEKLLPRTLKHVHSENDFDHTGEVSYMEVPDGQFVKVYNFKKFLTYSTNPDEKEAIRLYQLGNDKDASTLDRIHYMLSKIEWKKLLLYGEKYKNPLLTDLGIGDSLQSANTAAALISASTYTEGRKTLTAGVLLQTRNNTFILANNLSPVLRKPRLTLSGSENVADYKVMYPAPLNSVSFPFAHKYFGDFLIPLRITLKDPQKPLNLKVRVDLTSCNTSFFCQPEKFFLSLNLAVSGSDFFSNGYANYFRQSLNRIPQDSGKDFTLTKFVVDDDNGKQSLRLEFTTKTAVKNFKVFLEDKDAYSGFDEPLIRIQDNKIYVRFIPLEQDEKSFVNSEFIITAVLNSYDSYRTTRIAEAGSFLDSQKPDLNLAVIIFALLGGIILNFMPCVFPVLSLKIAALSQAAVKKKKQLKRTLLLTVSGIFCGFTLLTVALTAAKSLGYSLGWGMQYQSMYFLIVMTFLLSAMIILFPDKGFSRLSHFSETADKRFSFLLGNLIVLLATPCTGPYLATAVGFALTGTNTALIVILYSVALGLSLPYIIALLCPHPEKLFPKPGDWLNKLNSVMRVMLYLTVMWFFWLIYKQTDFACVIKLLALLTLFVLIFKLYRKFQDYLGGIFDESIPETTLHKLRRRSDIFIILFSLFSLILCSVIAQNAYRKNFARNMESRISAVDRQLIQSKLAEGKSVLLEIGADWCLTCSFNNIRTLNSLNLEKWQRNHNLEIIKVDWTEYNRETLDFMERYGRKGLPFYILYTPFMREGLVLPEIFSDKEFESILQHTGSR